MELGWGGEGWGCGVWAPGCWVWGWCGGVCQRAKASPSPWPWGMGHLPMGHLPSSLPPPPSTSCPALPPTVPAPPPATPAPCRSGGAGHPLARPLQRRQHEPLRRHRRHQVLRAPPTCPPRATPRWALGWPAGWRWGGRRSRAVPLPPAPRTDSALKSLGLLPAAEDDREAVCGALVELVTSRLGGWG